MGIRLDDEALNQLFRDARTFNGFRPDPVPDETVRQLYELVKWGPTAFNAQPARYVFVRSDQAKAKLVETLYGSNREKTLSAPLNVIVAYDLRFFEHLPRLSASSNARALFEGAPHIVEPTALRNGSLQGAYLILAARALGLGVGVISGFDADKLDRAFFPDGRYKANFIANLGHGDPASVRERAERFAFDEVAQIL
ncbi:malonic semialdehyde reductase [Zoogloea sp. LCSB751]|uniref:malonic semialdehyde reductase n=1 Tax=Zoogloea sp. LCSB751 TaxID=1965277 RepID=UPI0009A53C20|nr:malonic semialdehyde reductase [Zoogloea sp. LCSB751]